ncbi:unnamed protein product [Larinioides sclopetarius]
MNFSAFFAIIISVLAVFIAAIGPVHAGTGGGITVPAAKLITPPKPTQPAGK